jgi:serine/threonine-protein kinase
MTELSVRSQTDSRTIGRYVLYGPIARGGMATVHFARLVGADGFSRIVAAKRLHEHFAEDPDFVEMFRNEARIASCIHHPNVVPVLDLVVENREVILVQEYVHGVPLDKLFRTVSQIQKPVAPNIVVAIIAGVLNGLHAAHETKDERGEHLGIIHRDVTPHNIVVGDDGVPRLLDFGIAKARSSMQVTRKGLMKGKLTYMAPEQFRGEKITRKIDVYSVGVVMWELLSMKRLHAGRDDLEVLSTSMAGIVPRITEALADQKKNLSEARWAEIEKLEPVILRMMTGNTAERYTTAGEALEALVAALPPALPTVVADWVAITGQEYLERCQSLMSSNEDSWQSTSKLKIPTGSHPASGFKIATRGPTTGSLDSPDTDPSLSFYFEQPPRRWPAIAAWAIAGLLLFASAALVGILLTRPSQPPTVIERVVQQPVETAPAPPPEPTPTIAAAPPVTQSAPAVVATKTPVVQPRIIWKPAPPPVVTHAPAPPAATAPVDCDPPFYFEGTKKIFKPSCM